MPKVLIAVALPAALCAGYSLYAQETQKVAPAAGASASGRWTVRSDFHGTPIYFKLELEQQGDKLTGNFDGDKLEGTVNGSAVEFLAKDDHGGSEDVKGTLQG